MITVRKSTDRGQAEHGWLKSAHTFSFGSYHDENFMGFRSLRVINEDRVEPGKGFGTHPHHDAEIFTYVIDGQLQHRDSMGNGSIIEAGNLQYMSAGDGVTHSEFNPSPTDKLHFYQIWLLPIQHGGKPRYAEKNLKGKNLTNRLTLLYAGNKAQSDVVEIRQDAEISFGRLEARKELEVKLAPKRYAWIQIIKGRLACGGKELAEGDGAAISEETKLTLAATTATDFLFFEMN